MSILDRIEIICGDVREVVCDLLVLKYANGFYGADLAVAEKLGTRVFAKKHDTMVIDAVASAAPGREIGAAQVLYRGVGDLFDFRYHEIQQFAYATLVSASEILGRGGTMATTIHGPGYGLDEREAFRAQLAGYEVLADYASEPVKRLLIVEQDEQRAYRLSQILEDVKTISADGFRDLLKQEFSSNDLQTDGFDIAKYRFGHAVKPKPEGDGPETNNKPAPFFGQFIDHDITKPKGDTKQSTQDTRALEKPKLFAAMPFAEKYLDEYHIAFVEAAHAHGFLCERLDLENYVGDIIDEIFKRIRNSAGVVALLNENNPNVFLEVGYAMALDKPVILVAREDLEVAFDLRSQRRQTYSSIYKLRQEMTALIGDLKSDGTLS